MTAMSSAMGRYLHFGVLIAAVSGVLLLASGCGDGAFSMGDHHDSMHGGGGGAPQTPLLSTSTETSVDIVDYDFSPRDLTVRSGTAVTWTNGDSVPHDATDISGDWGTGLIREGDSATIVFVTPGTYEYLCSVHPNMKGTLTVKAAS